jgi:hypothetical protein
VSQIFIAQSVPRDRSEGARDRSIVDFMKGALAGGAAALGAFPIQYNTSCVTIPHTEWFR